MSDPFQVVRDFESALCEYTGAKYAVTTTSCTMALLLALSWWRTQTHVSTITIPHRTYIGVGMSVKNAGFDLAFSRKGWGGGYRLLDTPIYDYARRFTCNMYLDGDLQCVSFHWGKILGIGQGGAILLDSARTAQWLRRARFDGRTEQLPANEDVPTHLGYHAIMMPRDAAEGLTRLALLPDHNDDLPNSDYPDLSTFEVFKS